MIVNRTLNRVISSSPAIQDTLLDLTGDSVAPANLALNETAHDKEGEGITGSFLTEDAEAWAVGTRNGIPVEPSDVTYHNNSYWYAKVSETEAVVSGSCMRIAGEYADAAEESSIISGSAMRIAGEYRDEAYNSAVISGSAMRIAGQNAENAEAWAVGKRDGEDVPSTDPTYHNNSAYWAEYARQYAAGGIHYKSRIYFADIPTSGLTIGDMYDIKDDFITDSRFEDGAGIECKAGTNIIWNVNNKWDLDIQGGSGGHTILDEDGITYPQRSKLQFEGCEVTDDAVNNTTIVKCEGGGGHTIVDEEGTELTQRSKLQFNGAIVSDDETNDETVVETVNPVEYEEDIYGVNLLDPKWFQNHAGCTVNPIYNNGKLVKYTLSGTTTAGNGLIFARRVNYDLTLPVGETFVFSISATLPFGVLQVGYTHPTTGAWTLFKWQSTDKLEFTVPAEAEGMCWTIQYVPGNNRTFNNLDIHPMLRKATIQDDTYRPYNQQSIQHQLTEQTNVLGAKNLIPYPYYRPDVYSENGVTFTVNKDHSVTVNGTASNNTDYAFCGRSASWVNNPYLVLNVGTEYELTGCPAGSSSSTYFMRINDTVNNAGHTVFDSYDNHTRFTYSVQPDVEYPNVGIWIRIMSGQTINNLTFKPMLRLASDPDDTYVPYAMTNRELTENITDTYQTVKLSESVSVTADGTTNLGGLLDQLRSALTTYLSGISSDEVCKITNLNIPNYSGALTCRDSYYNITNNSSGFSPTFYGIAHNSNAIRNHFVLMRSSGSIAIAGNINASGSSYEVGTSKVLTSGTVITVYLDKYKKI